MPSLSDIKVVISTAADTKGIKDTEDALGGFSTKSAAIFGAISGAAQSLVSQGINLITSSVGDAVKRVDTLNNSNRTFENMGFSASATKDMMHQLDLSIRGLPTTLSDAVTGVELLTGATNDIGQSRKIFDALNDGIIGFGGSAEQVNGAIIQISQAFSNGKVDAQTWNSLIQNGMGPALDAMARKAGVSIGQFKSDLSTGKITVADFQQSLIDLDTKGGGGMSSLNKIAHDSTSGISTGIANAKTAVTRGIADIITAIGTKNISNAIADVGKSFETIAKRIPEYVKTAVEFLKQHHMALSAIAGVIVAVVVPAFFSLAGSILAAMVPLLPFIAIGTAIGVVAQLIANQLGGWHTVLRDIETVMHPLISDTEKWYDQLGGLHGIIHIVHTDVFNFLGLFRELIAAFTQSTAIVIITQFFQQVFLPALKAIWAAIAQNLMPALEQLWTAFTRLYNALQPGLTDVLKVVAVILGGVLFLAIWLVVSALNVIIQAFSMMVSAISIAIGWIANLIGWFGNLVGATWNAVSTVISIFRNLWPAFRDVVGVIGAIIGGVGGLILSPFQWAYNAVVGLFRNLPHELGSIISGAFSGVTNAAKSALHGLHIPGFATGVTNFSGGLAVVGEQGPELVNLPAGSDVYTNKQSQGMMGGGQTTYNIQSVNLTTADATNAFFAIQDRNGQLASMGMSVRRAY